MLGGLFSGFGGVLKQASAAFALFGESRKLAGLAQLAADAGHASAATLLMGESSLKAREGFAQLGKAAGTLALDLVKMLALFAAIATVVGVAVAIAIGIKAVKAAGDFQQGLNRLVTGAGDVTDNMTLMGQAILGISVATGVLTDQLLPAMYQIISAGQRGAEAENTLAVAARGAVAEQANVVDVAKALTTAMTDYGTAQFNATQFMNGYTRAVQLGKITLEELSNAMGPILPIAKNLGVSFADVAAAMSTMTNAGVPAQRAATSLRFMFQSLENPTKKASTAMTEFGLNTVAVANEMKKSLPGALQMIYDAAKRAGPEGSVPFNRAVSDMIGGQRSLQAFLSLTGGHFKTYVANTKAVTDAMNASKTAVLGWDTAQKNFNVKLDQGKAAVHAVFIAIGTQLLPKLGDLLGIIMPVVQQFSTWATNAKPLSGFLDMIAGALQKVFGPAKNANQAMAPLTDTFDRAKGVIKAVGTFLSPLADTFDRASGSMKTLKSNAQPMLDTFDRAKGVFKNVHEAVNPLVPLLQWLKDAFLKMRDAVVAVYTFLVPIALFIAKTLTPYIQQIGFIITTVLVPAWNAFVKAIQPYLPVLLLLAKIVGVILIAALILVGATILLVVGAVLLAIGIFTALVAAVLFASTWIHDKIKWLVDTVVGFFKWLWQQLIGGSIIPDIVNGAISWFNRMKTQLSSIASSIVNAVVSFFAQLPGRALSAIASLASRLAGFFGGLASQAISWGRNLINGFLAGLQNAWNTVVSWVNGALSWLKSHFPGSPVKAGPLRGYENWGYTFGMGIADGIRRSVPHVQSASALLAASMGGNYQGSYSLSGSSFGGGRYPTGGVTVVHNHIVVMPPDVKLDGASVTDKIMQRAGTDVRRHGGPIKWG